MLETKLINNVPNMRNRELVGLAKNRFISPDLQMAIAKTRYRVGISHLAENENLHKTVRDWIWSDECNRGYTMKCELIRYGRYISEPDMYEELYDKYLSIPNNRSTYRVYDTFLFRSYRFPGTEHTPSSVLNRVYDDTLAMNKDVYPPDSWGFNDSFNLRGLSEHPNCDLKLAIKLSTCGIREVEKRAFQKIVELS